jgi:hypothetical protein
MGVRYLLSEDGWKLFARVQETLPGFSSALTMNLFPLWRCTRTSLHISPFLEIAGVLVRLDHVASFIVNENRSAI